MSIVCAKTGRHFSSTEAARECGRNCATKCPYEHLIKDKPKTYRFLSEYEAAKRRVALPPHVLERFLYPPSPPKLDKTKSSDIKLASSLKAINRNPQPTPIHKWAKALVNVIVSGLILLGLYFIYWGFSQL
ncbi:hypothetical protein LCGC14_1524630 [marine sediment metagenome]|uniref:Uncharacterized protein n=1 Tax=marine sediment metagenome TaxID=412755 RepID=A0A0F9IXS7_9ZZZZ